MKRIKTWLTTAVIALVLRSEFSERPDHPTQHSGTPTLIAQHLESLPPLAFHLEHVHDETVASAEALSAPPSQIESEVLSVVMPLYNDGGSFSTWWSERPSVWRNPSIESMPIDDGSRDDTAAQLAALAGGSVKPLFLRTNHGYSESLRRGIDRAAGKYVVMAAFQDVREVTKLEPLVAPLRSGSAVLTILVRKRSNRPPGRFASRLTRLLLMLRLRTTVTDLFPACWAMSGSVAKHVAEELSSGDLFLNTLHWVARSGGRIIEIPFEACTHAVGTHDDPSSTSAP